IYEVNAALRQRQRAAVWVAAGRRVRDVHHTVDPTGDQVVGRYPVDVLVIDDRDVAGLEPLDEPLGALAEPGRPLELRQPTVAPVHGRARGADSRRTACYSWGGHMGWRDGGRVPVYAAFAGRER